MTKKLKNLSLSLTCVRQLPRQREPSVYGWQITSARLAGQQKSIYAKPVELGLCPKKKNHPLCGWILISLFTVNKWYFILFAQRNHNILVSAFEFSAFGFQTGLQEIYGI